MSRVSFEVNLYDLPIQSCKFGCFFQIIIQLLITWYRKHFISFIPGILIKDLLRVFIESRLQC